MNELELYPIQDSEYNKATLTIACGCVLVRENKVLLVKDMAGEGDKYWKFPGGKMRQDESFLACASREAYEEAGFVGIEVDPEPYIYLLTRKGEQVGRYLLVHYKVENYTEKKGPQRSDIESTTWFPIDQLPKDIAPNIVPTLKHFSYKA